MSDGTVKPLVQVKGDEIKHVIVPMSYFAATGTSTCTTKRSAPVCACGRYRLEWQ